MPADNNPTKTRWQIEAEIDQAATDRMNAMLDRISARRKAEAAGEVVKNAEDDAWADSRAETLKYKLAQAQQEAELEKLYALKAEAEQLKQEQEFANWKQYYAVGTTSAGPLIYPSPYAFHEPEPAPEPKKPVEVPILTFGKRRINLKDVA